MDNNIIHANFNKESEKLVVNNQPVDKAIANVVTAVVRQTVDKKEGMVNCFSLNIRQDANKNSKILSVVKKNDVVSIDMANSTFEFFKVKTSDGIDGYCVRKFITLK